MAEPVMLQRFKIKTRLLISFSIVVFFSLIIGLTGFTSLTNLRTTAIRTINNVHILNEVYEHNVAIDAGLFNLLYVNDAALIDYIIETIKEDMAMFLMHLNEYVNLSDQFRYVFTPGEIQSIGNLFEIYNETYSAAINEIVMLMEQGRRDEALAYYINRFVPMFDMFINYTNFGFTKNLELSALEIARNSEAAIYSSYFMLALVLTSLIASVLLALAVTKSIAAPLSELGVSAEKVARGELDAQFDHIKNNDEIGHLSQRLNDTLQQLKQAQRIKLDAIETMHQKEKAEASSKSKGEFLAKMSHEIRTPMNAITGMAELALREDMPDAARGHVFTIKQAAVNLLAIINDILDISKIESGKMEIVPAPYLFSSLINDVISITRMRFIDSQICFITNIDSNIPNLLFGDETRIRQVLLNLLSNAEKFTESGFVSLTVMAQPEENMVNLVFTIEDSGRGIKQEDIEKLFGEFIQVDLTNNRDIEGTGLGLAITRNLIQAMGGDISVSSEYGKGSVFTIMLPQEVRGKEKLAAVQNPEKKQALVYEPCKVCADSIIFTIGNLGVKCTLALDEAEFREKLAGGLYSFVFIAAAKYESNRDFCLEYESSVKIILLAGFGESVSEKSLVALTMPAHSIPVANALNETANASGYSPDNESPVRFTAPSARILVVDDISTNLKVAEGLMLPYKMQIDTVLSGSKAIEAIKNNNYDLVFMDHMMPVMDGIETVALIRKTNKQLPVVALTANVVSGMREMFIEKGFDDLLSKPIDVSKLDDILIRWLPKEKRREKIQTEKKLIILVDDEPANLRQGKNILSKEYRVATAPSAEKLFSLLDNNRPELILLDMEMPVTDGRRTIEMLKSKPETKDIPVILLAGPEGHPDTDKGLESGAAAYISKPFDPAALFDCISKYIRKE